uniref:Ferric-chelate reductase 1 n=1 Tax=Ditylenchus dipsaci TaxID=166011 RepID=A0A915ENE1_9BILA
MFNAHLLPLILLLLPIATKAAFDGSKCGKVKNCVEYPTKCLTSGSTCEYLFSYQQDSDDPDQVVMELQTQRSTSQVAYISVGFSADNQMGEDAVTHCAVAGENVEAHLSQNPGKSNTPQKDLQSEKSILQLMNSEVTGDYIYCQFKQKSSLNSNDLFTPDLSKPVYILLARGPASSPTSIRPHSFDPSSNDFPYVSAKPLNLFKRAEGSDSTTKQDNPESSNNQAGSGPFSLQGSTKLWLIRFHGVLMIIAWLGCVAVAIYSARYLRKIWPNTTPMGLKIWFHIHRTLNVCAVVLMLLAALSIFIGKDLRWTGPWLDRDADQNLSAGGIHSAAGLIATLLAITQPIGALLRCSNEHPKRPIFNGVHHTIGYLGLSLALISIIIAVFKFNTLEVLRIRANREHQRVTAIELHSRAKGNSNPTPSDSYYYQTQKIANTKHSRASQILFAVFALICSAATALLVLHLVSTKS